MNKALINKYKAEFDHWLAGGSIQHKPAYIGHSRWIKSPTDYSWTSGDYILVIDDEYVEFRKALAEGKTIEGNVNWKKSYDYWKEIRADKEDVLTAWKPNCLRIKPDEPVFKVGDWIRSASAGVFQCKSQVSLDNSNGAFGDWKHWQPQPGEYVFAWSDFLALYVLTKVLSVFETHIQGPGGTSYTVYQPFIGTLPSK